MLSYIAGSSYEWMPFHCVYMSACSSLTGESADVIASQTPLRFTNEPVRVCKDGQAESFSAEKLMVCRVFISYFI